MKTIALTIPELKSEDANFEEGEITEVQRTDDGYWITRGCIGSFLADKNNPKRIVPKVGDTARVYGRIGQAVYGLDLNGHQVYWHTEAEREADRTAMLAKMDREKRERYETDREMNERKVQNLPDPLRLRIERFRAEDKDGEGRLWEAYEIFCCEQATVIADVLRPKLTRMTAKEAVEWFRALPYEEQTAMGLSDQHSGNTFGGACSLAYRLLEGLEC